MARPLKDEIDYFSHNTDMSSDPKIEKLDFKFQNDGYAIYLRILERVYKSNGDFNILSEEDYEIYAGKFWTSKEKLREIICYMREINLFPEKNFISRGVSKRLQKIKADRNRKRNYYKKKEVKDKVLDVYNTSNRQVLTDNAKQTKLNKTKLNKTKLNKIKCLFRSTNFFEDFELFKKEFHSNEKYKCFDAEHYFEAVKNWSDSGNNMKKDWIATARNFALTDKNPHLINPNKANIITLAD